MALLPTSQPHRYQAPSLQRSGKENVVAADIKLEHHTPDDPKNVQKKQTRLAVWQKKLNTFWNKWRKQLVLGSVVTGIGMAGLTTAILSKNHQNINTEVGHISTLPESGSVQEELKKIITLVKSGYDADFSIDNKPFVNVEINAFLNAVLNAKDLKPRINANEIEQFVDTSVQAVLDYSCLFEPDQLPGVVQNLFNSNALPHKLTDPHMSPDTLAHQALPNALTDLKQYVLDKQGSPEGKAVKTTFQSYYQLHEAITLLLRYGHPKEAKSLLEAHGPGVFKQGEVNLNKPPSTAETLAILELYGTYFRSLDGNRAKQFNALKELARTLRGNMNSHPGQHTLDHPPASLNSEALKQLSTGLGVQIDDDLLDKGSHSSLLVLQMRRILMKAVNKSSPTNAMDSTALGTVVKSQFSTIEGEMRQLLTQGASEKEIRQTLQELHPMLSQIVKAIHEDRLLLKPNEMRAVLNTLQTLMPVIEEHKGGLASGHFRRWGALNRLKELNGEVVYQHFLKETNPASPLEYDASIPHTPVGLTGEHEAIRTAVKHFKGLKGHNDAFADFLNQHYIGLVGSRPSAEGKRVPSLPPRPWLGARLANWVGEQNPFKPKPLALAD